MLRLTAVLLAAMLTLPAQAGDWPEPEHHEFNPVMPAELKGEAETLETAGGTEFDVYVSGDPGAERGILIIHEWWGLNDHIRGWADRFAAMGFRAMAVDLYDGKVTDDPDVAGKLMKSVDAQAAKAKLGAALDELQAPGRKLATIGWCFGGGWSLEATLQDPEAVSATVIYYGKLVTDVERLKSLEGPVLGVFALKDGWITPEKVAGFEAAMVDAGRYLETHSFYADHAFSNPSGGRFNEQAAQSAWRIVRAFLKRNLD